MPLHLFLHLNTEVQVPTFTKAPSMFGDFPAQEVLQCDQHTLTACRLIFTPTHYRKPSLPTARYYIMEFIYFIGLKTVQGPKAFPQ